MTELAIIDTAGAGPGWITEPGTSGASRAAGSVRPARVLAVGAHPDDIDFGAGATLATWAASGAAVVYCVVTDGGAGGHDRSVRREEMPAIRRAEQRAAAAAVGASDVLFLGYEDGSVTVTPALRRDLTRAIRSVRPDVVVCPSPVRNWTSRVQVNHPDHLAVGEATLCAVYPDARNPFAFSELLAEGLEPHEVGAVWLVAPAQPTVTMDVTDGLDRKLAALACHVSQLPGGAEQLSGRVAAEGRRVAQAAGLAEGHYAEAFQVVVTAEGR